MNAVNDILGRVPLSQLADALGTDEATAEQAARQAIASLVGGMANNANDAQGAASLAGALNQHSQSPFAAADSFDLGAVDTEDGGKIVSHIFGSEQDTQVASLGGLLGNAQVQQLLKTLAPIVMGYLAGKLTAGGGLGDLLGGILGGGGQSEGSSGGGGLGDLLGGLLGGGAEEAAPQSTQSTTQAQNPFDTGPASDDGDLKFPTPDAEPSSTQQEEQKSGGGILGDILGGIFGKK